MQNPKIHRRHFLIGAAGTAGGVALVGGEALAPGRLGRRAFAQDGALPDYVAWKNAEALIVHSSNTIETKRDFVGASAITPSDILYVRNNLSPPGEEIVGNPDAWQVAFEGVAGPQTLTLADLKRMGVTIVATVLQCSGNGRGFFDHEASGAPWQTGAAGCVLWTGVPLAAVAEELGGVVEGARFITSTGGETIPDGIDPKTVIVERSVPVEALDEAVLAWEMNGAPLTVAHGGPLRIVIPGYYGINSVKYVEKVAFTEEETDATIQASGYRVRPVGVDGAPDQPTMWEMKVKSWVTRPLMDAASGEVQIYGVAFGGVNGIDKVEVTTDGGTTWQEAALVGPDLGRFAWRVFVLPANLVPGSYVIASRATDTAGRVQAEVTEPNHRAYDYDGWSRLAVDVTVA